MEATRDYIAGRLKNPKAAKKLMTALLKAISLLADNPYMGAALAEKFEITTDVRYFVVSKQLIFYHFINTSHMCSCIAFVFITDVNRTNL